MEHKTTTRVLDILETVADHNETGLKFSEIVQIVGEPKGTVHPLIMTLTDRNYLFHNSKDGRFYLGNQISHLHRSYNETSNILEAIEKEMQCIVNKDFVTAFFGVLSGNKVLYLIRKEATGNIRIATTRGSLVPANCTGLGKALLSQFSRDKIERLFSKGLPSLTENSITDIDILCGQLQKIRRTGIAYEVEESTRLIRCIATPVIVNGRVLASLSAAFPTLITGQQELDEIQDMLLEAKRKIADVISEREEQWMYS